MSSQEARRPGLRRGGYVPLGVPGTGGPGWPQAAPPSEGRPSGSYENRLERRPKAFAFTLLKPKMHTPPWSLSGGFIAWKESQGNGVGGGCGKSLQMPPPPEPTLLTKLSPPVQIPPRPRARAGEERLMAKWPRSQSKHSESVPRLRRRLAPRGRVCSEPTGPLMWGRAPLLGRKAEALF